jgi:hypothetical protein
MAKFSNNFNFDDSFIRTITLGVISEFYRKIRWINKWQDKEKLITLPVYYGLTGDERFLLDAFIDDIIGNRPELNIDPIPRAHIVLDSENIKQAEFSNPNVYMNYEKVEKDGTLKKEINKFKVLPIQLSYSMEIKLKTEIDALKCVQSLWDWLWNYKYFYITYNSLRVDSVFIVPDDLQREINRQIDVSSSNNTMKTINFGFQVHTNYPVEPKESKPQLKNCGKVIFKGKMHSLKDNMKTKTFIGGNVNKNKGSVNKKYI